MKKGLLFAFAFVSSYWMYSQFSFTMENSWLQPGVTTTVYSSQGSAEFEFNTSGPNNVWDFSALPINEINPIEYEVMNVEDSPCPDAFTSSSFCARTTFNGTSSHTFITMDEMFQKYDGQYSPGNEDCIPYDDPTVSIEFPFSYADEFEVNGGGNFYTKEYVAFGSLLLPTGEYYEECALIVWDQPGIMPMYLFYAIVEGRTMHVFYNQMTNYTVYSLLPEMMVSVEDNSPQPLLALIPNGNETYSLSGLKGEIANIRIMDSTGRMVKELTSDDIIEMASFSTGIYFLDVMVADRRQVFRIMR